MLSHLLVAGSPRHATHSVLLILVLAALCGPKAWGADIMAPTPYAPGAAGTVSDADLSERGTLTTGFTLSGAESALQQADVSSSGEENEILRDAHRGSAFFGLALTKQMEFVLGLHGSYEHVNPGDRELYFLNQDDEEPSVRSATDRVAGARQSSFAGASLMFKVGLLREGPFRLSVAPFIESGAGEQATYALTRSVTPKVGWMVLGTFGQEGTAVASINAGYRYRNPEEIGILTLRNELFYRASLKAYVIDDLALFTAADARKIMVNKGEKRDDNDKLLFEARETAGWSAGLAATFGDAEWSAYYGGRFKAAKGFGFGDRSFGMSISYALGHIDGRKPKPGFAQEVEREMQRESSDKMVAEDKSAEADKAAIGGVAPPAAEKSVAEEFPEMIGTDIDPLELFKNENDDFKQTEADMAEYNKVDGPSSDQLIENELQELKIQEQKDEEMRQEQEQRQTEQDRAEAREQAEIEDENMREWMQEAEGDLEEVEGISEQEMNWNGLE